MPFNMVVSHKMATANLDEIGPDARAALEKALRPIAMDMAADARRRAQAHIRFFGIKPGFYVASIYGGVASKDKRVLGYVRSKSPLAHLMELGANPPAHVMQSAIGEAMKFTGGAGVVFARKINHPGAMIPAYPAIGPAFEARKDAIRNVVETAVRDVVGRAF